ncbi:hypothetical protein [Thalassospira xiamenensis]|uniref:Uncharacterized protein n=1 Tax=Thalassospira xiamenensis TaxID=220697 RepID=A0A285THB5_9PROT|nr:hypothetical protein [Thalassospira xiamenensis]SOC21630.1 hypothetical protein SAMN05428964_103456 [Thalassospira xiamenensis]
MTQIETSSPTENGNSLAAHALRVRDKHPWLAEEQAFTIAQLVQLAVTHGRLTFMPVAGSRGNPDESVFLLSLEHQSSSEENGFPMKLKDIMSIRPALADELNRLPIYCALPEILTGVPQRFAYRRAASCGCGWTGQVSELGIGNRQGNCPACDSPEVRWEDDFELIDTELSLSLSPKQ